ncbi:hydrogenase maturation protease [Chloroflexota bacterium]
MRTLVLGLGNPILTDDGVGIRIAQKVREARPELEVVETTEAGIALLDFIVGCDKLILVDSINTGYGKPGELYKLEMETLKPAEGFSLSHGIDIATAFKLGHRLGYKMPEHVSLYAVGIRDNMTFGEECTREVEKRLASITRQIIKEEKL